MTPIILDTSAYSATGRGDARLKPWLTPESLILLPVVVIGELQAGFAIGNKRQHNERLLQQFMAQPNVTIVDVTQKTANIFAEIFAELRADGKAIGLNDMWIAALAREYKLPLLTLDKGFGFVRSIELVNL